MENHFTATGFVFNPEGKVLMIKHKKLGVWLPPGGHIDENELPNEAALREIYEETGIMAKIISATKIAPPVDSQCVSLPMPMEILLEDIEGTGLHNHIDLVYLCTTDDSRLRGQEAEIDGIGWFSPEEALMLDTFANVISSLNKAIKMIKDLRGA